MPNPTHIYYFWIEMRQFGMFTEAFSMPTLKLPYIFHNSVHDRPAIIYANLKK